MLPLVGSVGGDPAIQGGHGDAQVLGDLAGREAVGQKPAGRVNFAIGHLAFAAAHFSPLFGSRQASVCPLQGEFAFHLGQAGHHVEEEAAATGAGVDGICQAFELDVLPLELGHQVDQVLDAAAQAIEFPNDQGVAGAENFQSSSQARPVATAAAELVLVDLFATRLFEGLSLEVQVLILC